MKNQFRKFLSVDSPKAIKAGEYGFLNGINYMAPHNSGGHGNLCPHASAGCIALCLGEHSGQAAMSETVRDSRKRKASFFMNNRTEYMAEFARHIARVVETARTLNLKPAIRPNGSTDIAYEGIPVTIGGETFPNIMAAFPTVPFIDYTKNPNRFNRKLPDNYFLTFSLSETNEPIARKLLARGINVAAVFGSGLPDTYLGAIVLDGDKHDLRHLDPKGGFIIGLSPKGSRAKRDRSGFVIRDYQTNNP